MRRIPAETVELVPQAILSSHADVVLAGHGPLDRDCDGLGDWVGAVFEDDDGVQFAVRTYGGFPPDSSSIYVDVSVEDVDRVLDRVDRVRAFLGIEEGGVTWRRGDVAGEVDWNAPGGGLGRPRQG